MNLKDFLHPKEFIAELLGTFLLTIMAKGAALSLGGLQADPALGNFIGSLTAGMGVMMGILITGGASGGHINPAVSLSMAAGKKLKLALLPSYLLGQYLGAFLGSLLVVGLYSDVLLNSGLDRSAHSLASFPGLSSNAASLFFDQLTATFLLILLISAVVEQGHQPGGLLVGLSVAGIGCCFGPNAGAAMNPAVDLMPRLVAAIWEGYFKVESHFWVIPFAVPHFGGILAVFAYDFCIVGLRSTKELPIEEKPCLEDKDVEKSEQ